MKGCTGYTPAGLLELAKHAKQLKRLTIARIELSYEAREIFTANGCEQLN